MRTAKLFLALAPLLFTTAACTAILGNFDFNGQGSGGNGTGGNGNGGHSVGGNGGTGGSTPLTVTAASTKMGVLRAQTITASAPVTWTVDEGPSGGSIDTNGRYLSPEVPGTYHVTGTASNGDKGSVAITVVPLGLNVLAGIPGGRGNVDGPANRAHFDGPTNAAFSAGTNDFLIISDTENHTIRAYDFTTQKVTTIAGLAGVPGTADGVGSAARFSRPQGVVIAGKVVFVADGDNNCIRAVSLPGGAVTTLSGQCGSATAPVDAATGAGARFDGLRRLTINAAQTALFACEVGQKRDIRRIDLTTGGTQTVVTNLNQCDLGQAAFNAPNPIWFTDGSNPSLLHRFVEGATPPYVVQNFASLPYTFSDGIAVADSFGGDHWVYMAFQRTAIIRFDLTTMAFETTPAYGEIDTSGYADGPGAAARFDQISGLARAFGQNHLYVVDGGLAAIREIKSDAGTVTTKIGAPDVYDRIDGTSDVARLTLPIGIASDENGALYIADARFDKGPLNNTLRLRDPKTGAISTLAGAPKDVVTPAVDGVGAAAKFGIPFEVVYEAGNAYVLDAAASAIRKVEKDGTVSTVAGQLGVPGSSDGFGAGAHFSFTLQGASFGMALDGKGHLFVSDGGNYAIRRVVLATGEVTTVAGGTKGTKDGVGTAAQFLAPAGLAVDGDMLYIADVEDHTIRRMDLGSMAVTTFLGSSGNAGYADGGLGVALFERPFRLLADGIGNLFVVEITQANNGSAGTIRRVALASQQVSTFAGKRGVLGLVPGPLTTATLNRPFALTLMPNGDLAVADFADHAVAVISPL